MRTAVQVIKKMFGFKKHKAEVSLGPPLLCRHQLIHW